MTTAQRIKSVLHYQQIDTEDEETPNTCQEFKVMAACVLTLAMLLEDLVGTEDALQALHYDLCPLQQFENEDPIDTMCFSIAEHAPRYIANLIKSRDEKDAFFAKMIELENQIA